MTKKKRKKNQKSPLRINLIDFAENQFPNLHYFSFEFLTIIFCFTFSFMINIQQHFSSNNFCLSVFLQQFLFFSLCVLLSHWTTLNLSFKKIVMISLGKNFTSSSMNAAAKTITWTNKHVLKFFSKIQLAHWNCATLQPLVCAIYLQHPLPFHVIGE